MRAIALGLVGCCVAIGCGGDDSTIPPPGSDDGGDTSFNNDTGATPDTGSTPDAPSDTSPVPDSSTFQVGSVNGLVLWLDANKGVTVVSGKVVKWADQTTHGNDAKGSSMSSNYDPTQTLSAINSLPAIHFDKGMAGNGGYGNELDIVDNADFSLQWGNGDFYVVVVARYDNALADGTVRGTGALFTKVVYPGFGGTSIKGVGLYANIPPGGNGPASNGIYFQTDSSATNFIETTTAYNTGVAHQFAGQRVGTTLNLRVDGATVATGVSGGLNVDTAGTQVRIGADFSASVARLDGDIAEIIAVKGTLAASDQSGIEGYLKSKYAL